MDALFWVRLGFVLLCLVAAALCVLFHAPVAAGIKRFFCEPGSATNLGLLRIVIFASLLDEAVHSQAAWYTSLDPSFLSVPRGWVWLADFLPLSPRLVRGAQVALIVSASAALIGLLSRVSCLVAGLLAIVVVGVPNFYFKINHGMHVPVLTALLLGLAPAGDAVSVDALIRRLRKRAPPADHVAYSLPLRFAWLLTGTMYLFPGLWKLWETGDLWIDGIKLKVELFEKWAQMPDYFPSFRADQHPWLLALLGTATLVIEIGFLPAMFHRTTRVLAGLAAMGFHLGVGFTMNIWFNPWYPLIVLLDLPKLLELPGLAWACARIRGLFSGQLAERWRRLVPAGTGPAEPRPGLGYFAAATTALGGTLVCAMFVAGIGPVDSWPIAIYPRFSTRDDSVATKSFALSFAVRAADGSERDLPPAFEKMADPAAAFRIARATLRLKSKRKEEALERHIELLKRMVRENFGPFAPGDTLLIYRSNFVIDPDERRQQEPNSKLVIETEL